MSAEDALDKWIGQVIPSYQILCFAAEMDIIWEYKVIGPVDNFLVGFVGRLRAERRVSDETFEHDGTK